MITFKVNLIQLMSYLLRYILKTIYIFQEGRRIRMFMNCQDQPRFLTEVGTWTCIKKCLLFAWPIFKHFKFLCVVWLDTLFSLHQVNEILFSFSLLLTYIEIWSKSLRHKIDCLDINYTFLLDYWFIVQTDTWFQNLA